MGNKNIAADSKLTKKQAQLIIGSSLSNTSKMPCYSFNLSALHCKTGSKLVKIKGSVCYGCYALKGRYAQYKHPINMMPKTEKINHPLWISSMVYLINNQGNKKDKNYFRWHDSGDLQSLEHLKKIVEICKLTPNVKHWLPTREYKIVRDFLFWESFPDNLTVRLSAHLMDKLPPSMQGVCGSTVTKDKAPKGLNCPANTQNGQCLDCRACWDISNKVISYNYH